MVSPTTFLPSVDGRDVDPSRYDYSQMQFPLDLESSQLNHFVLFNINQSTASKYIRSGSAVSITTNGTTRTKSAIALYFPDQIQDTVQVDYQTVDNTFLNLKGNYNEAKAFGKNIADKIMGGDNSWTDIAAPLIDALGIGNDQFRDLALSMNRTAVNPHITMLFRSMGFRSFNFRWKFTPKTEDETISVYNIIRSFKFHSVPELRDDTPGRYWIYPSEFDISFHSNGSENTWINRIASCVLTNYVCNYTGSGLWSAFRNGAPVTVELDLTFTELEVLTKNRVAKGF